MKEFADWLKSQIRARHWTQAQFAKRGGISASQVSHVVKDKRNPGDDFLKATGRAFNMPVVEVYKIAGVLPKDDRRLSDDVLKLAGILEGLSPEQRAQVVEFAEFLRSRSD